MTKKHNDMKFEIAQRDSFTCQKCGQYLGFSGCLADRISQGKGNRKKYGNDIIDHSFNKVYTCISNDCNDPYNIGNNPEKCKKLVKLIKEKRNQALTSEEITLYLEG